MEIWPVSGRDVLEGQACFSQLQYLAFASGGKLGWDDFRALGILHGVYIAAFEHFLRLSGLDWPPVVDHPTVGLFMIICDMAINSGSGFPHPLVHFPTFISDTDPGARFTMMSLLARTTCPEVAGMITQYSRDEYKAVCALFAKAMLVDSPLAVAVAVAATGAKWAAADGPFSSLMQEYATYQYQAGNQPVRVMFSHFLAFMEDKLATPEIFCWPGAWMAGWRVNPTVHALFDKHGALFVDKEHDDGVFPRLRPDRDAAATHEMFETFYAVNVTYDMTDQWITRPGPFTYDFRWLSPSSDATTMKAFADRHFQQVFGQHPDTAELLQPV